MGGWTKQTEMRFFFLVKNKKGIFFSNGTRTHLLATKSLYYFLRPLVVLGLAGASCSAFGAALDLALDSFAFLLLLLSFLVVDSCTLFKAARFLGTGMISSSSSSSKSKLQKRLK